MPQHDKAPNGTTEDISGRQMAALLSGIAIEIPRQGDPETVKAMIANTKKMKPVLKRLVTKENKVVIVGEKALLDWHAGWPRFWRAFGFRYNHEALILPEYRDGFGWSIVTPELSEWPASRLLHEVCGRMFPTWQFYEDKELDEIVSAQEPVGVHVVLVRDGVEADEDHKAKSATMIDVANLPAITIRQREVLEARYYFETDGHLNQSNLTICAGSRLADGRVPSAYWFDDEFHVSRVDPDNAYDHWRVRETVSSPAQA